MFIRIPLLTTMVVAIVASPCATCGQVNSGTPSQGSAAPMFAAGSVSGGYLRGPHRARVIVFVNGIFGDAVSTWKNDNGSYWPSMIMSDHTFDDADVYVHSFQSPKLTNAQQIVDLASRFRDFLATDGVFDHQQIVFLVHSMGGLVTRAMIVNARLPASKIPMIFFFATPSAGADVAAIGQHLSENRQLVDMLPLKEGGYVKTLREEWLQTSGDPHLNYPNAIASYCAYELMDTWHVRIVPELSATYLCNRATRSVLANHLQIVKPKNERDDPYVYFKEAYRVTFGQRARAVSDAMAEQTITKNEFHVDERATIKVEEADVALWLLPTRATSNVIDVGCEETREGDLLAAIKLKRAERVVDVRPVIADAINVKSSWAAVVRNADGAAVVRYSIRGLDREALSCPGRGHADVIVNFVVERERYDKR